jgi:alkylresorcinol/alkylpyrone synthase
LALESLDEGFNLTPDALHARFARHAPALATEAAQRALENAAISSSDVDALQVSTCTGYLCPGLTSYVAERLGLRSDVLGLDLVGQGCGAAIPNLRTAEALVASGRAKVVLSVCVEVCSAAFYLDDDPGVLISACLFGDGAGAAVLAGEPGANRRIAWRSADSHLDPSVRECLRFETRDGMLRNILGAEVPAIAARQVTRLLHESLANSNLRLEDISGWIVHPGGRDVLTAIHREVGLPETALKRSADILKEYGNLSSPSVLFVLQRALAEDAPGGHWWMTSFGAGFSCHGALLEVSET